MISDFIIKVMVSKYIINHQRTPLITVITQHGATFKVIYNKVIRNATYRVKSKGKGMVGFMHKSEVNRMHKYSSKYFRSHSREPRKRNRKLQ